MLAEAGENLNTIFDRGGFRHGRYVPRGEASAGRGALFYGNLARWRARYEKHPRAKIVICADYDRETYGNRGVRDATEAATAVKGDPRDPAGKYASYNKT